MTVLNPVLGRELKERMRGVRSFAALAIFLALLTLATWIVYRGNQQTDPFSFDLARQTRVGRELYEWILSIMLVLVLFFVPGLTAGAIAGERERQTLLPLQVTLLRPRSIVWGKVLAALAYLALMIVAALPLFAVAYQLGGITLLDGLKGLGCVLLVGLLLATIVVGISAFAKRVQTATILAYGVTGLLTIGSFAAFAIATVVDGSRGPDEADPPALLLTFNPIVFVADATAGLNIDVGTTPLRPVRVALAEAYARNDGWWTGSGVNRGGEFVAAGPDAVLEQNVVFDGQAQRAGFPAWALALGSMVVLAAGAFAIGCRRLRTPAEVER